MAREANKTEEKPGTEQAAGAPSLSEDAPKAAGAGVASLLRVEAEAAPSALSDSQTDYAETVALGTSEEMVNFPVLDEATNRYKIEEIPLSRAEVITAGMMRESWEGVGGGGLLTDGYNKAFHYAWIPKERTHPATLDAMAKGYRPHFIEKSAAEHHGHAIVDVPGWGKCQEFGDSILMAVPAVHAEMRLAQYEEGRQRDRAAMTEAGRDHMEQFLDGRTKTGDRSRVIEDRSSVTMGTYELGHEARSAEAESLARAQAYSESLNRVARGQSVFGGLQGKPGFNNAVPDSPGVRRIQEALRAQSELAHAG